jgi:hypothetical protein
MEDRERFNKLMSRHQETPSLLRSCPMSTLMIRWQIAVLG